MLSSQQVLDGIKDIWRVKCQFELLELGGAPADKKSLTAVVPPFQLLEYQITFPYKYYGPSNYSL